jgi:hypothetical protein
MAELRLLLRRSRRLLPSHRSSRRRLPKLRNLLPLNPLRQPLKLPKVPFDPLANPPQAAEPAVVLAKSAAL